MWIFVGHIYLCHRHIEGRERRDDTVGRCVYLCIFVHIFFSHICVITIIVQKKVKEEMTRWEGVGKWFHCPSAPVLSVDCHGSRCIFTFKIHICHGSREVNSVEK